MLPMEVFSSVRENSYTSSFSSPAQPPLIPDPAVHQDLQQVSAQLSTQDLRFCTRAFRNRQGGDASSDSRHREQHAGQEQRVAEIEPCRKGRTEMWSRPVRDLGKSVQLCLLFVRVMLDLN